jgi:hypothetical protein
MRNITHTPASKLIKSLLYATATLAIIAASGCKTAPPTPSGFLSDYTHLQKVDNSTWRYVDASQLGSYQRFTIPQTSVMVKAYLGTALGMEQQQAVSSMFRQKLVNALSGRYEVVGASSPGTPEVRAAITQAYRVGNALAMGVEAEIVDAQSHKQLAAIRGVRIGPPEVGFRLGYHNPDASGYMAAWWNWPSAVELMEQWAGEIRGLIDEAHRK